MRKLLVDDVMVKAWQEAGFEKAPEVSSPNLDNEIQKMSLTEKKNLIYGFSGGGHLDGLSIATPKLFRGKIVRDDAEEPQFAEHPIPNFIESTGAIIDSK